MLGTRQNCALRVGITPLLVHRLAKPTLPHHFGCGTSIAQNKSTKQSTVLDLPVRDRAPETRIVRVSGIVDGRQVSFPLTVTVSPTFNFVQREGPLPAAMIDARRT